MKKNKQGFTLIELLVVIAIIGLLATLSIVALSSARARARDAKRVSDIKQIQTALELYYADNNSYPTTSMTTGTITISSGTTIYLPATSAPTPADGSNCSANNAYKYNATTTGTTYTLTYCLGSKSGEIPGNQLVTATPISIK